MKKIIILLLFAANYTFGQTTVIIGNTSETATAFPSASSYIKSKLMFSPFVGDTSIFSISNVGGIWKTVPIRVSTLRGSGGAVSPWSIAAGHTDYSAGVVTIGGDFAPSSPAGKMTLGSYATGGYNYIQSYASLPLYLNPIGNNTILSNDTYSNYIFAGKFTSNSEAKLQIKNNKFTQFSLESTVYPNGRLFSGVVATGYGSFISQNSFYVGGGTYEPSDAHSGIIQFDEVGNTVFYNTNGLTAGTSYTPTERFKIGVNGSVTIVSQSGAGLGLAQFSASGAIQRTSIDPAHVLVIGSAFGGDVSGTYDNLQLGTDVVTSAEIANNAVGSNEIASSAVINSKIGSGAVTETKIANGAVTGLKMTVGGETAQDVLTYVNGTIGYVGRQLDYLTTGDVGGTFGSPIIKQFGATTGQVLTWNGTNWRPATPSGGGGGGVPSGTANQTLRYNGTTLEATSQIQVDTTVGIGGAATVFDELTVYGTTKSLGAIKVEGTGLNAGIWITNTTPTTGINWKQLVDNTTGFLYFQENTTGDIPLEIRKTGVTTTNLQVKDAIYKDVLNVGTDPTIYQVTGTESLISLISGTSLTTINLPEIVTGTPVGNQVNKHFTLTLVIKSPNAVIINRAGSDTFLQHATTGSYTSFPIGANTTAILELIALDDNIWTIK